MTSVPVQIFTGDCRLLLKTLDAGSVNCCVTSPPYFGLRQYLFDKAVIPRLDLSGNEKETLTKKLESLGILPRY